MVVNRVLAASAVLTIGALAALPVDAAPLQRNLDVYRVSPVVENGKVQALTVEVRLRADGDGETRMQLPAEWGGGERLWRFLKDPVVTGGQLSQPDEKTWAITSKPRAALTLRYRVVSAYDGPPPPDSPNFGQPIIGREGARTE